MNFFLRVNSILKMIYLKLFSLTNDFYNFNLGLEVKRKSNLICKFNRDAKKSYNYFEVPQAVTLCLL